jgi:hypothetical protein
MAELVRVDGRPVVDYMARDYESLLLAMRERIPEKLPEWRNFANEADFGNVLLELFAHIGDILSFYQDRVANESFLGTARTRRSVIEHLRLIGYELGTAAPAATTLAVAVPATVSSKVTIERGAAFATSSRKDAPSVRFEYTGPAPLTIDFATRPVDQASGRRVFTGVPVEEGRLFTAELLGVSDGTPNQRFPLAHPGVILRRPSAASAARDITVLTRLGAEVTKWTLQESLAFSQGAQHDVAVRIDADDRATILFGDGTLGAKPDVGATVTATYRVGGGRAGNVPAGTVTTIVDAPPLAVLGATVTNPVAGTGGAQRESIEHAVQHAPGVFRAQRRAVTSADYEEIARTFNGVAKVRAVATGWNEVTLFVAPEGTGRPKVSDVLEAQLKVFFEDKRMVTQIVEVADVDYVPIMVTAELAVERFYLPDDVLAEVRQAAAGLLAFDRVGFAETLYLSRFYECIQDVPGVVFLNITEFRRADVAKPLVEARGRIDLGRNEIPVVPDEPDYAEGLKIVPLPGVPPAGVTRP